ncbi:thioesterase family protein [Pacificoceanicola onchidii]|uniref:thioesterase family protein n=1 Tax=Pacificoceanicola onchidii TaxID=2562685 RepID=UPI0010A5F1A9|nr:thioesterase family protein [Pacificoceanicola onchidii]
MYPFIRLFKDMYLARRAPKMGLLDTHISYHRCMPWDLDMWMELNNGRTLTIYDLGRIPMAERMGLIDVLKQERWGLTIAGSVVRYRRRVRLLDKVRTMSRVVGWDQRFVYIEQSMWKGDECTSHAVYRSAVTDRNGIVTTDRIIAAMKVTDPAPELPEWIKGWIDAEAARPWPPMQD